MTACRESKASGFHSLAVAVVAAAVVAVVVAAAVAAAVVVAELQEIVAFAAAAVVVVVPVGIFVAVAVPVDTSAGRQRRPVEHLRRAKTGNHCPLPAHWTADSVAGRGGSPRHHRQIRLHRKQERIVREIRTAFRFSACCFTRGNVAHSRAEEARA